MGGGGQMMGVLISFLFLVIINYCVVYHPRATVKRTLLLEEGKVCIETREYPNLKECSDVWQVC